MAGLQMFPTKKIAELNISAVPKSTQYATKYGVKNFKGRTAFMNSLVYFQTVQKATVSTAGVEFLCCSALKLGSGSVNIVE